MSGLSHAHKGSYLPSYDKEMLSPAIAAGLVPCLGHCEVVVLMRELEVVRQILLRRPAALVVGRDKDAVPKVVVPGMDVDSGLAAEGPDDADDARSQEAERDGAKVVRVARVHGLVAFEPDVSWRDASWHALVRQIRPSSRWCAGRHGGWPGGRMPDPGDDQ